METLTNSNRTIALTTLFDYHTGFYQKALDGISEKDMHNRLGTEANHPAWIAGSLVQQRILMAGDAGKDFVQSGAELFKDYKGIQADAKYPSAKEYLEDWKRITPLAREGLVKISDEKLDSDFEMPQMKMTYYELISFSIYREANMIGQLALWRRLLGYSAIKYD